MNAFLGVFTVIGLLAVAVVAFCQAREWRRLSDEWGAVNTAWRDLIAANEEVQKAWRSMLEEAGLDA